MNSEEKDRIESISENSLYAKGPSTDMVQYTFEILKRRLAGRGGRILELGPAEGVMTERLAEVCDHLTLVEGSSLFCDKLSVRFPNATVVNSLFEDFETDERFDVIVMGHVLEHVENPTEIVEHVKSFLANDNSFIFAAVPNARSLHRQAAVIMGLLAAEDELNELDLHHGHRRVFNPETFRQVFLSAGLEVETYGGYWLKPVSNSQIEGSWNPEMLNAFMKLGERYPDIAAENYVIAKGGRNRAV